MSAPELDVHGNPFETSGERVARVERRRKAGLCQRSRYCRRPARRPGARYCPACRALMDEAEADMYRETPHLAPGTVSDLPDDLDACPSADDFGAYR